MQGSHVLLKGNHLYSPRLYPYLSHPDLPAGTLQQSAQKTLQVFPRLQSEGLFPARPLHLRSLCEYASHGQTEHDSETGRIYLYL